jgi:thiamine biosynthesis lipoprotein
VAAGGDVRLGEPPPGEPGWQVGIRGLDKFGGGYSRVVTLSRSAVSTSGDAEQFVEIGGFRYSHIVDRHTGLGLTNRLSATVIAPSGARADALATAASVLGVQHGLRLLEGEAQTEGLIIFAQGEEYAETATEGFPKSQRARAEARHPGIRLRGASQSLC